jgi:cytochrome c2
MLTACGTSDDTPDAPDTPASPPETTNAAQEEAPHALAPEPRGDVDRGKALVAEMQCNRCHDGLDEIAPIAAESHCFGCHQNVMADKFAHKPDNARWKKNVAHLTHVPSLLAAERFDYRWLVGYLLEPHDLRPNLTANMPRLALDRDKARDIASYLTRGAAERETVSLAGADIARGRKLLEDKGCGSCHLFGGVAALPAAPLDARETRPAVMLAPDLRHARERLDAATLIGWLRDPGAMKAGTLMPETPMSDREQRDIAAYILQAELAPAPKTAAPTTVALLDRAVGYDEVAERLFDKTCRHCHGDPDVALGDGGPGNTGGFGFPARGLQLTSYARVLAGYKDDDGERHSVFKPVSKDDATPRIVASLLARHSEEAGAADVAAPRGMPLGLPPVPIEDIQLLATWIAQGRPR